MKRRALAGALLPVVFASPLLAVWCVLCLSQDCMSGATETAARAALAPEATAPCHMASHDAEPEPLSRAVLLADGCCKMMSQGGAPSPPAVTSVNSVAATPAVVLTALASRQDAAPRGDRRPAPPPEPSPPLYTLHSSWLI